MNRTTFLSRLLHSPISPSPSSCGREEPLRSDTSAEVLLVESVGAFYFSAGTPQVICRFEAAPQFVNHPREQDRRISCLVWKGTRRKEEPGPLARGTSSVRGSTSAPLRNSLTTCRRSHCRTPRHFRANSTLAPHFSTYS